MLLALCSDVLKLGVAVRWLRASQFFAVGTQALVVGLQEAANDWTTDHMALDGQLLLHIDEPAIEPLGGAHRITRRVRLHQGQQRRF
jgi:hypothetical protein